MAMGPMRSLNKSKGFLFFVLLIISLYLYINVNFNGTREEFERITADDFEEGPTQVPTHFTIEKSHEQASSINEDVDSSTTRYNSDGGNKEVEKESMEIVQSIEQFELGELDTNQTEQDNDLGDLLETTIMRLVKFIDEADLTTHKPKMTKEEALDNERRSIAQDMENYWENTTMKLDDLLLEKGGKPIRNIIFTTWRSGSTFMGEAITSHPSMFYHYEPLLHFEIVQVRSGDLANEGLRVINNLLKCNYSAELDKYINYGMTHTNLHTHNIRLWKYCQQNLKFCGNDKFLSEMCRLFPFQVMKTVRMRLYLAESLINDEDLDVRILFLVRDPRGTMLSRHHRTWCPENPDCDDPSRLCSDMVEDYKAAVNLKNIYPDKIMILRYEDISLNPYSGVKKVLSFFRLKYHSWVDNFIKTHTTQTVGGVSSTFRDSKSTPFLWIDHFKNETNALELNNIQDNCEDAMKLWGYNYFDVKDPSFSPITYPPWKDMIIPSDDNKA